MFQKPAFGANASGFGMQSTFGAGAAAAASPFGGFKPAAAGSTFGAPPAFGASTSAQPATGGLFGATNTSSGLFGATTTPAATAGFGATTSGFGFGGNATTGGGLFNNSGTGGLFQPQANNAGFGAKPAGFGFGGSAAPANTSGGLFGNTQPAGTVLFGQQNNTMGGGGLFANNAGGFGGQQAATGTAHVKYSPLVGTDVIVKGGSSQTINIKHHCITCMKEYESKSLEELRLEDYTAGNKGAAAGVFGFQQQENKPLFGATNTFGQPATTSAPSVFGAGALNTGGFGQTNTFSFGGATQANANQTGLFGAQKPAFGAANTTGGGLFGAPASTQASTFGTNTSTFGFGSNLQNQNTGGLFGAKAGGTGFGAAPASTGFGSFGAAGGGLFGAKPLQTQAPTFGAPQPATAPAGELAALTTFMLMHFGELHEAIRSLRSEIQTCQRDVDKLNNTLDIHQKLSNVHTKMNSLDLQTHALIANTKLSSIDAQVNLLETKFSELRANKELDLTGTDSELATKERDQTSSNDGEVSNLADKAGENTPLLETNVNLLETKFSELRANKELDLTGTDSELATKERDQTSSNDGEVSNLADKAGENTPLLETNVNLLETKLTESSELSANKELDLTGIRFNASFNFLEIYNLPELVGQSPYQLALLIADTIGLELEPTDTLYALWQKNRDELGENKQRSLVITFAERAVRDQFLSRLHNFVESLKLSADLGLGLNTEK